MNRVLIGFAITLASCSSRPSPAPFVPATTFAAVAQQVLSAHVMAWPHYLEYPQQGQRIFPCLAYQPRAYAGARFVPPPDDGRFIPPLSDPRIVPAIRDVRFIQPLRGAQAPWRIAGHTYGTDSRGCLTVDDTAVDIRRDDLRGVSILVWPPLPNWWIEPAPDYFGGCSISDFQSFPAEWHQRVIGLIGSIGCTFSVVGTAHDRGTPQDTVVARIRGLLP